MSPVTHLLNAFACCFSFFVIVVCCLLVRMLVPYGLGSLSSMMDYRQLGQEVRAHMLERHLYKYIIYMYTFTHVACTCSTYNCNTYVSTKPLTLINTSPLPHSSIPLLPLLLLCWQLGGIPLSVYQAARSRLAFTKQLAARFPLVAPCRGDPASASRSIAEEVSGAVREAGQQQGGATSRAGRVRLDRPASPHLQQVPACLFVHMLSSATYCSYAAATTAFADVNCNNYWPPFLSPFYTHTYRPAPLSLGACRPGGAARWWWP
jgi:hypothetical protein